MPKRDDSGHKDPRLAAGVAMLGRTGAEGFQLRFQDDEQPVVWIAVVHYKRKGGTYYEAMAGMTPVRAVLRLCEQMIDGGECAHCHRPTGFEPDEIGTMPLDPLVCWYQWDPEMQTFRRACEGDEKRG